MGAALSLVESCGGIAGSNFADGEISIRVTVGLIGFGNKVKVDSCCTLLITVGTEEIF